MTLQMIVTIWVALGVVGWIYGTFIEWYSGLNQTLGEVIGRLMLSVVMGPLLAIFAVFHALGAIFNANWVVLKGRKSARLE